MEECVISKKFEFVKFPLNLVTFRQKSSQFVYLNLISYNQSDASLHPPKSYGSLAHAIMMMAVRLCCYYLEESDYGVLSLKTRDISHAPYLSVLDFCKYRV